MCVFNTFTSHRLVYLETCLHTILVGIEQLMTNATLFPLVIYLGITFQNKISQIGLENLKYIISITFAPTFHVMICMNA